ncbi:hypothetical protein [Citrobacter freundii]|uniref:hypothetical protein n=1 Tax=Citrobacter freundii TaxID=546 RepID=UPI00397C3F58
MKKIINSFLTSLIAHSVLVLLIASIWYGNSNLADVAVGANWVLVMLGLFLGMAVLILSEALSGRRDDKQEIVDILTPIIKKQTAVLRVYGFIRSVAVIFFLSYSGWIVTAVVYGLTCCIFGVCVSIARDKVDKFQSA